MWSERTSGASGCSQAQEDGTAHLHAGRTCAGTRAESGSGGAFTGCTGAWAGIGCTGAYARAGAGQHACEPVKP